jgi:hypothetical protein
MARALLNGVQALEKDGYDFVAWSEPRDASLMRSTTSRNQRFSTAAVYDGVDFIVRGWKSSEGNVQSPSLPIARAIADLKAKAD